MRALSVRNLDFYHKDRRILNNINFYLENGESLSILGANGSGKSTLLKCLLGFLKFSGNVEVYGKNLNNFSKKQLAATISYIPQTHHPSYEYSVFDVVLMGALCRTPFLSNFSKEDRNLALLNCDKMGILHLKDEAYTRISGGERQICLIARALTQKARIIFMDEPTNGLDFGNQIRLLELIKNLSNEAYTIVQTTHYPRHAKFATNKALLLKNGEILAFGCSDKLVNLENINRLYNIEYEIFKDEL